MDRSIPSSASVCQPKRTIALFNHELTQKYGGQTRWLLRTYGLDTSNLTAEQRYSDSSFSLFP